MGPGLPGIGLASVFYVLLAVLAPLREIVLTVRGRSSVARWRVVGVQFILGVAVVGSVLGLFFALDRLAAAGVVPNLVRPQVVGRLPNYALIIAALAMVLLAAWLYGNWLRFASWARAGSSVEFDEAIAAGHREVIEHGGVESENRPPAAEHVFNWQRIEP